jgi:hypothetical protein
VADALEVSMTRVLDKAKKHRKAHNTYLLLWIKGRKKAEHDD